MIVNGQLLHAMRPPTKGRSQTFSWKETDFVDFQGQPDNFATRSILQWSRECYPTSSACTSHTEEVWWWDLLWLDWGSLVKTYRPGLYIQSIVSVLCIEATSLIGISCQIRLDWASFVPLVPKLNTLSNRAPWTFDTAQPSNCHRVYKSNLKILYLPKVW